MNPGVGAKISRVYPRIWEVKTRSSCLFCYFFLIQISEPTHLGSPKRKKWILQYHVFVPGCLELWSYDSHCSNLWLGSHGHKQINPGLSRWLFWGVPSQILRLRLSQKGNKWDAELPQNTSLVALHLDPASTVLINIGKSKVPKWTKMMRWHNNFYGKFQGLRTRSSKWNFRTKPLGPTPVGPFTAQEGKTGAASRPVCSWLSKTEQSVPTNRGQETNYPTQCTSASLQDFLVVSLPHDCLRLQVGSDYDILITWWTQTGRSDWWFQPDSAHPQTLAIRLSGIIITHCFQPPSLTGSLVWPYVFSWHHQKQH